MQKLVPHEWVAAARCGDQRIPLGFTDRRQIVDDARAIIRAICQLVHRMSSNVKVAVAQLNCTVGDFEGNSRKIIEAASRAAAAGADLLLTPELSFWPAIRLKTYFCAVHFTQPVMLRYRC